VDLGLGQEVGALADHSACAAALPATAPPAAPLRPRPVTPEYRTPTTAEDADRELAGIVLQASEQGSTGGDGQSRNPALSGAVPFHAPSDQEVCGVDM
jgi:hypothetical protein